MKSVYLFALGLLLPLYSLAAESPASQLVARDLGADNMVRASDIGMMRRDISVSIPAGHKIMVLYRTYHHGKLDEKAPNVAMVYIPPKEGGEYVISVSVLDPDELSPEPSDKIKLSTSPLGGRWLTTNHKTMRRISMSIPSPLQIGRNYRFCDLEVGEMFIHKENDNQPEPPSEWHVVVMARVDALTSEETKTDRVPQIIYVPAERFPLKGNEAGIGTRVVHE